MSDLLILIKAQNFAVVFPASRTSQGAGLSPVAPPPCQRYAFHMAGRHHDFWAKHPGLVWSNPEADDSVHIRAGLLRPRFDRLLDIAVAFGLERVRHEWSILLAEDTPEARRARASVDRILTNIEKGFSSVATRD